MRIQNTLKVDELEVSEPCLKTLTPQTKFDILGPADWQYDSSGNLPAVGIGH